MKKLILLVSILFVISCSTKEDEIKAIIDDSYFGIHRIKKMSEINKIKDDILSFPVINDIAEKTVKIEKENEYEIVRYIYKTNEGVNRIFYLIDLTNKKVKEKSSNYNDFFKPILTEMIGESKADFEGNNLMELMRY